MSQVRHNLDELLARMPAGNLPAKSCIATDVSKPSDAMASLAERTLKQIAGHAHQASRTPSELGDLELEDLELEEVLRTPLPLEPGEPGVEGFGAVAPLASGRDAARLPAFGDVFAPELDESEDFDPLRIPQKSGEHAPVRRVRQAEEPTSGSANDLGSGRSKIAWIWGGASALAAAAALVLLVRGPGVLAPKSEASLGVTATDHPNSASAASGVTPVEPASAPPEKAEGAVAHQAPVAAAPAALVEEAAKQKPSAVQASSPRKMAGAVAAKSAAGIQGARAAADPLAPEEPTLVPAAGPSDLPDHPSLGAISAATAGPLAQARQCLTADFAKVTARVSFGSMGKVTQVSIAEPTTPPAVRSCISTALGRSQVAPFARKQYDASLTVSAR